jgi:quercetin dioxygenase-like cupin family protein
MSDRDQTSHLFKAVDEPSAADLEFQPVWLHRDEIAGFSPVAGVKMQSMPGGKMMAIWVTIEPNIDFPYHQHPHEQMGFMLEGALELTMNGESRDLRPGEAYAIPPMLPHKARTGPEGCVVLDVFTPPREDYRR